MPNTSLLTYPDNSNITLHVKRVHEYILQFKLVGILLTEYQQWQNLIRGLTIKVRSMLETSASNEISQPVSDRSKNLPSKLRIKNAAAFVLSGCIDKGVLKDISAPKKSTIVEHAQIFKYFAKKKKCFYCGDDRLKNNCDKYVLVDKETRQDKTPYVPASKKDIHEIALDERQHGEDDETEVEFHVQPPSMEIDSYPDITSDKIELVEKQFVSILNLDYDAFEESKYNCVTAIKDEDSNDEESFDEHALQQIMAFQDAIPICLECSSYEHLTIDCPGLAVKKM